MSGMRSSNVLEDGVYLAKCRERSALAAAANGHGAVWPEARMVIAKGTARFYRGNEQVWLCNAAYAGAQFEVTQVSPG